jgi:hypothetical protein
MAGRLSAALAAALLLALAPEARAAARDPPKASCSARLAGRRVIVMATLDGFFDPDLLRLVRLGLAGRLDVQISLQRKRFLLFSEAEASERYQALVTYDDKSEEFRIDGRHGGSELKSLTLDRIALALKAPPPEGPHLVRVAARLEVVTASSLLQVARWIGGRDKEKAAEENEGSGFSGLLVRSLLQDLARSASGTCALER